MILGNRRRQIGLGGHLETCGPGKAAESGTGVNRHPAAIRSPLAVRWGGQLI